MRNRLARFNSNFDEKMNNRPEQNKKYLSMYAIIDFITRIFLDTLSRLKRKHADILKFLLDHRHGISIGDNHREPTFPFFLTSKIQRSLKFRTVLNWAHIEEIIL